MSWNFGDILDGIGAGFPADAPALIHGEHTVLWGDFARRTNNLAAGLRALGLAPDDKVALYMRNETAYMETVATCFKARGVHVNVNYRYLDEELLYILDNSDAAVVVFSEEFSERVAGLRGRLPGVRTWLQVGGAPPDWAESFEELAEQGDGAPIEIERSEDDLLFIYTGGTTGMPKGVMWRAADLWGALGAGANAPANKGERPQSREQHVNNVIAAGPIARQIIACPLMHGTGLLTAIGTLSAGGCIITLTSPGFDAEELWDTVDRTKANSSVIVGDAFAKPMLNALDASPGRWSLASLKIMLSSGVMWSREVKLALLEHLPNLVMADMFGSSEAVGFGSNVTSKKDKSKTAKFAIGDDCRVFTEDHREVEPGSGERGFIARRGPIPLGYYKDPKKTAETFPTIAGVRYSIPGDWCTVEADGTLTLLGRGSACINTAGEKVYPEEVEEALKLHDTIEDALVVGVPDERWGTAVTAVVQASAGVAFDEASLREHVRGQLAGYKTPKRIFAVDEMFRAPNGKANYKGAKAFVMSAMGIEEG
jgi:acyl-CoA synthetase (AMP-forming)/AMP-acid ligase II